MDFKKFQTMLRTIVGDQPVTAMARKMGVPGPMLLYYLTCDHADQVFEPFLHALVMHTPGKVSVRELADAAGWSLETGSPQALQFGADFPKRALLNAQMWQACSVDPRVAGVAWNSINEMVDFFVYIATTERIKKFEVSGEQPYHGQRHQPSPYFIYVKLYYDIGDLELCQTIFMYFMHEKDNKIILGELGFLVADIIDNGFQLKANPALRPNYPAVQVIHEKQPIGKTNSSVDMDEILPPSVDETAVDGSENMANQSDGSVDTIIEGFGFYLYDHLDFTCVGRLYRFLQNHMQTVEEIMGHSISVDSSKDIDDLFQFVDSETGDVGIGAVIARIMTIETKTPFMYICGEMVGSDQDSCVMTLQWNWDHLDELVYPYVVELGISAFGPCYVKEKIFPEDQIKTSDFKREG